MSATIVCRCNRKLQLPVNAESATDVQHLASTAKNRNDFSCDNCHERGLPTREYLWELMNHGAYDNIFTAKDGSYTVVYWDSGACVAYYHHPDGSTYCRVRYN